MKIVTSNEMRRVESRSEKAGVSTDTLMENAGLAVAKRVRHHLDKVVGAPVLLLIGPGNNGGDGLVVARYLQGWGARPTVYLVLDRGPDDKNLESVHGQGVPILVASDDRDFSRLRVSLETATIVVDSALGTGRSRPIDGTVKDTLVEVRRVRAQRPEMRVLALDLPSGLDADSGSVDPTCLAADITVTLGYPKRGLYAFPGARHAGRIEVVDIGIPKDLDDGLDVELMTPGWAAQALPSRPVDGHKGTFGKTLMVAGSKEYVGAATLAAAAAGRVGAGLVTLAIPESVQAAVASSAIEPTYLLLPELEPGAPTVDSADLILDRVGGYQSLLIGCGLGQAVDTQNMLDRLLYSAADLPPTVVDADGLNFLAQSQDPGWWTRFRSNAVVTPHPGEMARLTNAPIEGDRIEVTRDAAARWNKVVVLKGAHTIVADPSGKAMVSPFANPALASAGTGDVLAGAIAGLLSQGLSLGDAAALAVYIHGVAGERVRSELGNSGLLASDLLFELPKAMNELSRG